MNEEYIPEAGKGFSVLRELYDWMESGLTAVLCVVLVFAFVARTIGVVGDSMFPTLQEGERLLATSLYTELKRKDIVVVTKPNTRNNEPLIKRVIATGGQYIDIHADTGEVYVDGERLFEGSYIAEPIHPGGGFEMEFPQVVPPGHIFVMGDNRNNSWDSRTLEVGMIDERYVLGKVIYRLTPYERFGPPDES